MGGPGSGPRKKKGGRPTKLTPALQAELCQLIEVGNYIETAAAACGVDRGCVRDWMKRGVRGEARYKGFSSALKRAEARAQASAVARIRRAGATQWQADAWFLERKWPDKWARRNRKDEPMVHAQSQVRVYIPDNGRLPPEHAPAAPKKAKK